MGILGFLATRRTVAEQGLAPGADRVGDARSAPMPEAGETVRLQALRAGQADAWTARVRSLTYRRIILEATGGATASDFDDETASLSDTLTLVPPRRSPIVLTFVRGDAMYQFDTRVVGSSHGNVCAVTKPTRVTRLQRRQYYRMYVESPTIVRLTDPAGGGMSGPIAVRLVNLSGGGALLSSVRPIPAGLDAVIRVPSGKDGDPVDVRAETLACEPASGGASRAYLIRLRFGPMGLFSDDQREAIIAYLYEQQRIALRNRKLLR